MKRLIVLSFAVSMALGSSWAGATHSWNGYHWARASNPIGLTIVDSVTGGWDPLLAQVSGDWTQSSVLNTSIQPGATGLLDQVLCQPVPGKIRACNFNYGPTLWFGLAQVWISGNHITQATTQVNDFYFTGTYGNDTARRHVLCQEIGHDFGLDHHRQASCMDDTNSTLNTPSHVSPNAHDYEQLEVIYAHTDSSGGARASPARIVRTEGETTHIVHIFWVR